MSAVIKSSSRVRDLVSPQEWRVREELACAYRLFDHFGWHELIYNHITVRVPGEEGHFLINPFGLMYREVNASNLVKIDVDGKIIMGDHPINQAGFVIHSAIHRNRPDAHAVAHTHTTAGQAVSCHEHGLLPMSFGAVMFHGRIAYHDYEGITLDVEEQGRLLKHLADKTVMILRNHGLLTCGPTLADAFHDMYQLQRACEVQVAALAGGTKVILPREELAVKATGQFNRNARHGVENRMMFDAMTRWMLDKDPGFLQ
ncbi:MAG: class II aldolase/adducin family protein [Betaproteobacteria bacterium]|nr:class II aldolase/adducin family protein [Betaproteobacteria bacterium]